MYIKNPQPYHYGGGYGVLFREKGRFEFGVITIKTEMQLMASTPVAVDLDGDGRKEIVTGWVNERDYDPENPHDENYRNVIYKNDGSLFHQIYERKTYDYLKVIDLDGNGIPEVLEAVSDYERPIYEPSVNWNWINVYNLTQFGIELTSQKYPKFYQEKKKEYQVLVEEARKKEEEAVERHKNEKPGPFGYTIYWTLVKALQAYIERIDAMLQLGSRGK